MGEPAGIGPDLLLQLFERRKALGLPPFIAYGNQRFLAARAERLGLAVDLGPTTPLNAARVFADALPLVEIDGLVPDKPGEASMLSGKVVIESIARAVADTLTGDCRSIVTAPIHKAALYGAGFKHPGHTEYLAALCASNGNAPTPVMMLAHEHLRAVPMTVHVPLHSVPDLITDRRVMETVRIVNHDLRTRFGIARPRIGVTGLNPHAGESGNLGHEDKDRIEPAVLELQHEGLDVSGPFPADTAFTPESWRRFDCVVAMYHDQALIPIKALAFDQAVNVTLGLPIVRTSPDHGTAFDLAGTGRASLGSMLAALRLADRLTSAAS